MDANYEEPVIVDHGSLTDLTLQSKDFTGSDGLDLLGVPLGNAS